MLLKIKLNVLNGTIIPNFVVQMSQNLLCRGFLVVYAGQGTSFRCNALRHGNALIETAKNQCATKNLPLWAEHAQRWEHLSGEAVGSKRLKESAAIKELLRWVVTNDKAQILPAN